MKQRFFKNIVLVSLLMPTLIPACTPGNDVDTDSPAYQIYESEKLILPESIELPVNWPDGNSRVATYFAKGVQKYKAQPKAGTNPVQFEWVFVAPQADLFDVYNKKVGTHSAGPTWQLFGNTDSIHGQQFSPPRTAPSPDPSSIDWLQLMPRIGKTSTGVFSNVSYILRIATKGGKAPVIQPVNGAEVVDVKYTAVYRFIRKN